MKCLLFVIGVVLMAIPLAAQAPRATADKWTPPRTSDGHLGVRWRQCRRHRKNRELAVLRAVVAASGFEPLTYRL